MRVYLLTIVWCMTAVPAMSAHADSADSGQFDAAQVEGYLRTWCYSCHSGDQPAAGMLLPTASSELPGDSLAIWEKVVRRLQNADMPPAGEPRSDAATTADILRQLVERLDTHATNHPSPGRTDTLRRLNRTEYGNAIRDLLGLTVDVSQLLPADESSHGFDNITVTELSPVLLNRYVAAAQKISRLALGSSERSPGGATFRVAGDVTQDGNRPSGLPLGTRGGIVVDWYFPRDGEYQVQVKLMRDRNDEIEGLRGQHELDILLDRRRQQRFVIRRPESGDDRQVDAALAARFRVTAGQHQLGVTFVDRDGSLQLTDRQPLNVSFNFYRHPRRGPAVYEVSITGPHGESTSGSSAVRSRILPRTPLAGEDPEVAAREILSAPGRLAYRRALLEEDLLALLRLFREGRSEDGSFEAGIERALAGLLVNPQFLFRVERDPLPLSDGERGAGLISEYELASRLSFFLWSSLPDEQLLQAAEEGRLSQPGVLATEVTRMLQDPRAESLVTNFADQWLYLRNLDAVTPDARLFPDFDQNLRDAFRRETELLFADMLREDRPVTFLLSPPWTWLNERLARHYGIAGVQGDRFRRVEATADNHRGGILRHGSILSVTSYATRTSPVLRGKWVLENLLGSPPPPPPPNVSDLQDNTVSAQLPLRQRLAEHRANAACAVCHDRIDPPGFALENFDATGRWRELESEQSLDVSGGLPDGDRFEGISGLEKALLRRPELFARTITEKLLVFALGRGLQPEDGAAVRRVVNAAANEDYRFSAIVQGIVASVPFRMRQTAVSVAAESASEN